VYLSGLARTSGIPKTKAEMLVMHIFISFTKNTTVNEIDLLVLVHIITQDAQRLDITVLNYKHLSCKEWVTNYENLNSRAEPEYLCIPSVQNQAVQVHQPRHLLVVDLT
jgi:hypothetical protein